LSPEERDEIGLDKDDDKEINTDDADLVPESTMARGAEFMAKIGIQTPDVAS
jgi:hypothetical protein